MRLEKKTGTVAPGKVADLVVVDGDPLANIGDARRTVTTVRAGVVFPAKETFAPWECDPGSRRRDRDRALTARAFRPGRGGAPSEPRFRPDIRADTPPRGAAHTTAGRRPGKPARHTMGPRPRCSRLGYHMRRLRRRDTRPSTGRVARNGSPASPGDWRKTPSNRPRSRDSPRTCRSRVRPGCHCSVKGSEKRTRYSQGHLVATSSSGHRARRRPRRNGRCPAASVGGGRRPRSQRPRRSLRRARSRRSALRGPCESRTRAGVTQQ